MDTEMVEANSLKLMSIFIFVLIICSNFMGELIPCKAQKVLSDSMLLKHLIGFFTLLFFVLLTIPELKEQGNIISSTIGLYALFLLFINCNWMVWICVLSLMGVLYLLHIFKDEKDNNMSDELMLSIKKNVMYLVIILLPLGFIHYLGEKRIEYGSNFNFMTFLFGRPSCKGESPNVGIMRGLSAGIFGPPTRGNNGQQSRKQQEKDVIVLVVLQINVSIIYKDIVH